MLVQRKSLLTGIYREMELDITEEQVENYKKGMLAQRAFPNLTDNEREFWISGVTQDEWDEAYGEFEEEWEDDIY